MAWYRSGTVAVTNGSATVTGTGTDFVANVSIGDSFQGPDSRDYEVMAVVSATSMTVAPNYLGATASGQAYSIQPTQSFMRDLALQAVTLLNTFAAVRDGVGQGLFPAGTVALPGIRFAADQDTGVRLYGANVVGLVGGGTDALLAGPGGVTLNAGAVRSTVSTTTGLGFDANRGIHWVGNAAEILIPSDGAAGWVWQTDGTIVIRTTSGAVKATFPGTGGGLILPGSLLVGVTSGTGNIIARGSTQGDLVLNVSGLSNGSCQFFSAAGTAANSAAAAIKAGANSTTSRSANFGGTVNASGADYAEYMTKAEGCGPIAAGDVCGVDRNGHLTRKWADANSYVVKSTDPAYVGGDTWAAHLSERPAEPGEEPVGPLNEPEVPDETTEDTIDTYRAARAAYRIALDAYAADHAKWAAAAAAYDTALPIWDAAHEAARLTVDRIAFCGQVPVNIAGEFAIGDYLIAAANGGGIQAVAVAEADITFEQYRRRLGKVWAIRDGRPWVDVQHG